jgi:hypothetical protein
MLVDGLDALSDEYPRDRAIFYLGIAEARVAQHGRLDEAVDAARTAINLVSSAPSPRVRRRLERLIHSVSGHADAAQLREELGCTRAEPA